MNSKKNQKVMSLEEEDVTVFGGRRLTFFRLGLQVEAVRVELRMPAVAMVRSSPLRATLESTVVRSTCLERAMNFSRMSVTRMYTMAQVNPLPASQYSRSLFAGPVSEKYSMSCLEKEGKEREGKGRKREEMRAVSRLLGQM